MTPYEMLLEFHEKFGAAIDQPLTEELIDLRTNLMLEELQEVELEFAYNFSPLEIDKKKLTKELADLMYVTIGTAITFGLPLEEVFAETHRSNMSKLGEDGKPVYRADGKVLKGPNYQPPNLDQFFEKN